MNVRWIKTTREAYAAIYSAHRGQLQVHGTFTRPERDHYGERHIMTEWGLPGADAPIIKHEERGEPPEHSFYLACVSEDRD